MAGPNLELFKFGLYLFFPLAVMIHYGDPEWYHKHVLPIRDSFWPKEETLYKPPRNEKDLKSELAELRRQRLERKGIVDKGTTTTTPRPASGPVSAALASLPLDHELPDGTRAPQRRLIAPTASIDVTRPDGDASRRMRLV